MTWANRKRREKKTVEYTFSEEKEGEETFSKLPNDFFSSRVEQWWWSFTELVFPSHFSRHHHKIFFRDFVRFFHTRITRMVFFGKSYDFEIFSLDVFVFLSLLFLGQFASKEKDFLFKIRFLHSRKEISFGFFLSSQIFFREKGRKNLQKQREKQLKAISEENWSNRSKKKIHFLPTWAAKNNSPNCTRKRDLLRSQARKGKYINQRSQFEGIVFRVRDPDIGWSERQHQKKRKMTRRILRFNGEKKFLLWISMPFSCTPWEFRKFSVFKNYFSYKLASFLLANAFMESFANFQFF